MKLENGIQLDNSRQKLAQAEKLYAQLQAKPADNARARALTLQGLKKTINQLKEEIARFEVKRREPETSRG